MKQLIEAWHQLMTKPGNESRVWAVALPIHEAVACKMWIRNAVAKSPAWVAKLDIPKVSYLNLT
jgi:hypothetical protein